MSAIEPPNVTPSPARQDTIVSASLGEVTVFDSFSAARAAWLDLEASGVLTPYQRFEWMATIHASGLDAGKLAIGLLGPLERPIALLPLVISRQGGLRVARLVGSAFGNSDWLPFDPAAVERLTPAALQLFLVETTRQAGGADLVRLSQLPAQWSGHPNPLLALRHQPAPNNLYTAAIGGVALPFIDHGISSKLRSNLRRGRARLIEQFGPVSVRRISDAAAYGQVHQAFLAQRGERFAQMGVDNIFATPAMVDFFSTLGEAGLGQDRPALMAHALYAGEEILATSFGAMAGSHFSQYINSTSSGPASKYSLMGILMGDMMDDLIGAGVTSFDMGTGDFAYKTDWSAPQTVFDATIPVSRLGALALPVLDLATSTKRAIKQNPRIWALAKRVKKLRYDAVSRLRR